METIVPGRPRGDLVEYSKTRLLDRRIVVVVDDIQPDYGIAALQQSLRGVKSDESGITGDQNAHSNSFTAPHRNDFRSRLRGTSP